MVRKKEHEGRIDNKERKYATKRVQKVTYAQLKVRDFMSF
jgi:hypothetical protein